MLRIYNSLSRKKERFKPLSGRKVNNPRLKAWASGGMRSWRNMHAFTRASRRGLRARVVVKLYTCGPTVYSRPHLGNYRTYLWEDTLKRYLLYLGYSVKHVMNITDFDKTILRAVKRTGVSREKMTAECEKLFRKDLRALGALPADAYPHVSDYTEKMARKVGELLEKGAAYKDEGGRVFFDISKFKSYGRLAGKRLSNTSRRVLWEEYRPQKAGDFLVWQPCKNPGQGDCFGSSRGPAQPPWNIQCAVMSIDNLGSRIDVAMGGTDNRFNHHENTRAIAWGLSHTEYAKYWVHIRHLTMNGRKMSKSKGNVVLLPDMLRRGFSPKEVRFLLLSRHYRNMMDFTWAGAREGRRRYQELAKGIFALRHAKGEGAENFAALLAGLERGFRSAMDDDLDVPGAIAAVERFLASCKKPGISRAQGRRALALLREFDAVLACLPL